MEPHNELWMSSSARFPPLHISLCQKLLEIQTKESNTTFRSFLSRSYIKGNEDLIKFGRKDEKSETIIQ